MDIAVVDPELRDATRKLPAPNTTSAFSRRFIRFATLTAKVAGKPWTFIACLGIVLLWAVTGPIFGFNETWQLVINTGTTIVTFLMVFLIQNTQNRDGAAIQAKLDELIRVSAAQNRFIGIEHLSQDELTRIKTWCVAQAGAENAADAAASAANQKAEEAADRAVS